MQIEEDTVQAPEAKAKHPASALVSSWSWGRKLKSRWCRGVRAGQGRAGKAWVSWQKEHDMSGQGHNLSLAGNSWCTCFCTRVHTCTHTWRCGAGQAVYTTQALAQRGNGEQWCDGLATARLAE